MFSWFKKKIDPDAALRARVAATLEKYDPEKDTTNSTFTDIDFGKGPVRVKKINIKALPESDPWSVHPGDTTQWNRDNKK